MTAASRLHVAKFHVVVPAAGVGRRMAGEAPKQYLSLAGRTVIEWSLAPFLARSDIAQIGVVTSSNDAHFSGLAVARDRRVSTAIGGAERADSVLRGVMALQANADDWVLVHDAARPCLHTDDLARLIDELKSDAVGGLLATPVSDTLKAADDKGFVQATVPRQHLWRALTPQMFRAGLLLQALREASERRVAVTDESAAVEALGYAPKLVAGRADNVKITVPEDLAYAAQILRDRET
jgi:2-C-methyl-D-erythritol 4-phosphate cytidylyltransferase